MESRIVTGKEAVSDLLARIGRSWSVLESFPIFTGKERDAETGLDYFGARYLSSAQGRWTSPDEPFADQDPADPQSWNLFGYVRNVPLGFTDPSGRCRRGADGRFHNSPDGAFVDAGATSVTVNEGAPELATEASRWVLTLMLHGMATSLQTATQLTQVAQTGLEWLGSRDPNSVLNATARGALGLSMCGAVGLAGGPGGVGMVPGGMGLEFLAGAGSSGAGWLISRSSGSGTGGGGGSRKPKPGISGKEGAKDVPSWAKGERPRIGESGREFAKRLLDKKYGPGNYELGPTSEFNRIWKWGDRAFELREFKMESVFILWHCHDAAGQADEKLIGVYKTFGGAEAARARLQAKPGFKDTPDGFEIHEYVVGRDGWTEGYVSEAEATQ